MKKIENYKNDGYNCGVFTLLMMTIRRKGETRYLRHVFTEDDLKKCRARLCIHIFGIFKVFAPKNQ